MNGTAGVPGPPKFSTALLAGVEMAGGPGYAFTQNVCFPLVVLAWWLPAVQCCQSSVHRRAQSAKPLDVSLVQYVCAPAITLNAAL